MAKWAIFTFIAYVALFMLKQIENSVVEFQACTYVVYSMYEYNMCTVHEGGFVEDFLFVVAQFVRVTSPLPEENTPVLFALQHRYIHPI